MAKPIDELAREWLSTAIIIIVGLYVITTMITQFCSTNGLFCSIVFGGVLSAIVVAAITIIKKIQ
jgi:hypothetical protein